MAIPVTDVSIVGTGDDAQGEKASGIVGPTAAPTTPSPTEGLIWPRKA